MEKFISIETEIMKPASLKQGILKMGKSLKMMILIVVGFSVYSCATLDSTNYQTRIRAVNKITDQNVLYKVALEDKSYEVKIEAFNKITDQNIEFDPRSYATYVLQEGTIAEKRELLGCLKNRLILTNKIVKIEKGDGKPSDNMV